MLLKIITSALIIILLFADIKVIKNKIKEYLKNKDQRSL
jgi:hypothetical protein